MSYTNTRKSILDYCHIVEGELVLMDKVKEELNDDVDAIDYLMSVIKTVPVVDNPSLLEEFNYEYRDGKLVNSDFGTPFHWVNQAHYDALGDVIVKHIQTILKEKYELLEVLLPVETDGPQTNVFMSENYATCEKLLVLIQGSGAVRAGQWARALCINDNLDIGTVFPYIERAQELNYGVVVLNPNDNFRFDENNVLRTSFLTNKSQNFETGPSKIPIEGLSSPRMHVSYVWEHYISPSAATSIAIVAHSAGGPNTVFVLNENEEFFQEKVKCIAFTDSVHGIYDLSESTLEYLKNNTKNWVTSTTSLDTILGTHQGTPCVSAGHPKHEFTSGFAIEGVFKFISEKME